MSRLLRLLVLVAVAATAQTATSQAVTPAKDPPRIVPWHVIGNAWLWTSYARLTYAYGPAAYDARVKAVVGRYSVIGGTLGVIFDGPRRGAGMAPERVVAIWTSSPRYRTRAGLGVGSHIPLKRCRDGSGYCWQGFTYHAGEMVWRKVFEQGSRRVLVRLPVDRGIVTAVWVCDYSWFTRKYR